MERVCLSALVLAAAAVFVAEANVRGFEEPFVPAGRAISLCRHPRLQNLSLLRSRN